MISKQFRLSERQVKKVLSKAKPFFSYGVVMNQLNNKLSYNRYALVIWGKSVNHNVTRNFFRRRYYEYVRIFVIPQVQQLNWPADQKNGKDIVCVVKKQTKLDRTNKSSIISFDKDTQFLLKKI